jgi:hypothetical protein
MTWLTELLTGLKDIAIVVFLGYGLKLMKQQNELLEREKALKQSEIDVHKANIERLKSLQAPAVARDLEQMTRTANSYAEKGRELEKQVQSLAVQNKAARELADSSNLAGICLGCLEGVALLGKSLQNQAVFCGLAGLPFEDDALVKDLRENIEYLGQMAEQAINGKKPEMKHFKVWFERYKNSESILAPKIQ